MSEKEHTFKKYVLYIAQDTFDATVFDKGSRQCMKCIPEWLKDDILVQSCEQLITKQIPIPEWLLGTPTLVCLESKQLYRGTEAVNKLKSLDKKEGEKGAIQGMTTSSERQFLDNDVFESFEASDEAGKYSQEGKVSEDDVMQYMERRKASMPQPPYP